MSSEKGLSYQSYLQNALRYMVRDVLQAVQKTGLPAENELYITFQTDHPEVEIPESLMTQYPEEMTIALRRTFWDLEAGEDGFRVTLLFAGARTPLAIGYRALKGFADPSVQFALAFEPLITREARKRRVAKKPRAKKADGDGSTGTEASNVVSFDRFRGQ